MERVDRFPAVRSSLGARFPWKPLRVQNVSRPVVYPQLHPPETPRGTTASRPSIFLPVRPQRGPLPFGGMANHAHVESLPDGRPTKRNACNGPARLISTTYAE